MKKVKRRSSLLKKIARKLFRFGSSSGSRSTDCQRTASPAYPPPPSDDLLGDDRPSFHPRGTWTRTDHEAETSAVRATETLRGKAIVDSGDDDADGTTISEDDYSDFCEWLDEVRRDWVLEDESYSTGAEPQHTDDELRENLEAVEETYSRLADKDLRLLTIRNRKLPKQALFDALTECAEIRRYVLLQLAEQLRGRIADRFDAAEHLRGVRVDLDARARRLEWEKSEVRISLEQELETRSIDHSMKLRMLLADEQELKKQVRELEERNQVTVANSEMEITNLKAGAAELRTQNGELRKDLSEMQEKLDASEEDRRRVQRCFCEKEKENKVLQRLVVSLKQECNEQARTISRGLRLGYDNEQKQEAKDGHLPVDYTIRNQSSSRRRDEVASLKKKMEELTEEKQIVDLKDSLEKPFDLICSSTSVEESQQK